MSLTPTDLTKIKKLVNTIVNPRFEGIEMRFEQVDKRFEEIEEKIDRLPTKEEFFTKMDEVITEVQTTRQEQIFISHRVSDLEDRVTALEKAPR